MGWVGFYIAVAVALISRFVVEWNLQSMESLEED